MNYLILSSSLDPGSRSRVLARLAHAQLLEVPGESQVRWLDAASLKLPLHDGGAAWDHPDAAVVAAAVEAADGIIFALGIYNYSASAVAKTLVELGDQAWADKVVGFICASGGGSSYMAALNLANALMLDFRCVIVPRFVFATGSAFNEDAVEPEVSARVTELVRDLVRMTEALRGERTRSASGLH